MLCRKDILIRRGKLPLLEKNTPHEAEKLREVMNAVEITVTRRVGEQEVLYGSVTTSDIADELEKKGFKVDKRKINLDDHIKQLGEFVIPIRLFADVVAEVKLRVEAEAEAEAEAGAETGEATSPPTESETESESE